MKPFLIIRIQLGAHLGNGQFLVYEVRAGLTTAILLQFDLKLVCGLVQHGQRGEGIADGGETLST